MIARCPNCGSEFEAETDNILITCKYCNASIFVTANRSGIRYLLKPTINPGRAEMSLREYLLKNDYTGEAKILERQSIFYPFYKRGDDTTLVPAINDSYHNLLSGYKYKGGELIFIREGMNNDYKLLEPELDIQSQNNEQMSLIFYPLIIIRYSYLSGEYRLIIDGFSQEIIPDILPIKKDTLKEKFYIYLFIITSFLLFIEFYAFESVLIGIMLNIVTIIIIWFVFPGVLHLIEDIYVFEDKGNKMS